MYDEIEIKSFDSLKEIKGIGQKTSRRLSEHFGSEKKALEVISKGDVFSIENIEGIEKGRGTRIVKNAIMQEYGDEILMSDTTKEIYEEILEKIKKRAKTRYAKSKIDIYFPMSSYQRIEDVRSFVNDVISIELKSQKEIEDKLRNIEPPKHKNKNKIDDRILLTSDENKYEKAIDIFPELNVELVDDISAIRRLSERYDTLFILDSNLSRASSSSISYMPYAFDRPLEVVPERILDFFQSNLESLINSIKIAEKFDIFGSAASSPLSSKSKDLESLKEAISKLDESGKIKGNKELDRLKNISLNLRTQLRKLKERVNERIQTTLDNREVKIGGSDLLDMASRGENLEYLLRMEIQEEYEEIISEELDRISSELDINPDEEKFLLNLLPDQITLPVDIDNRVLSEFEDKIDNKLSEKSHKAKVKAAKELKSYVKYSNNLISAALEFDLALAIKKFYEDFSMTMPKFGEPDEAFRIKKGINLFIEEPEPVDYFLNDVTILSGVNSGGKTSTLDLISQIFILAHMGFPVPAKSASLSFIEELYYYRASKRTLGSGAFESVLMDFESILKSDCRKLVLVDELENVTEPGASAKIVAGIIERLKKDGGYGVFVSHLAEKIIEVSDEKTPVDGIEARGLDENMELIVDRTPRKNHLATSTPELIVRKLSNQKDSEFYSELARKFK